jgi:hypothetical protein
LSCLLSLVPFVLSPALLGECYKLRGGVRQLYDAGRGSCPRSERGPTLIASRVWVSTCVMSDRSNHHDTARVSFYTSLSHAVCPSIVARLVIASSAAALRRQLGTMQLPRPRRPSRFLSTHHCIFIQRQLLSTRLRMDGSL